MFIGVRERSWVTDLRDYTGRFLTGAVRNGRGTELTSQMHASQANHVTKAKV